MVLDWYTGSSSRARYGLDKKYQEDWQIIMMINRANEFGSLLSTTYQERVI